MHNERFAIGLSIISVALSCVLERDLSTVPVRLSVSLALRQNYRT